VLKKLVFLISLFLLTIGFANEKNYKVYDCFTFFNELEVLKIRLNELYDDVDHFVIVESTKAFNGKKKILHFRDNEHLFNQFADKIIHIIVDNVSDENIQEKQTNAILLGLKNAKENDIVFISDVDEILSSKKIKDLIDPLINNESKIVRGELRSYRWFLNRWDPEQPFINTFVALKYSLMKEQSPYAIKTNEQDNALLVREAGWHFANVGFIQCVAPKLKAFNQKINHRYSKKAQMIIQRARDCILSPIDETYPQHIQKNIAYYKKHNFIDDNVRTDKTLRLMKRRERENNTKTQIVIN